MKSFEMGPRAGDVMETGDKHRVAYEDMYGDESGLTETMKTGTGLVLDKGLVPTKIPEFCNGVWFCLLLGRKH